MKHTKTLKQNSFLKIKETGKEKRETGKEKTVPLFLHSSCVCVLATKQEGENSAPCIYPERHSHEPGAYNTVVKNQTPRLLAQSP